MRISFLLALALGSALGSEPSNVLADFGGAPTSGPSTVSEPLQTNSSAAVASARKKGVTWLLESQHSDGGWSSGNHGTDGSQAGSDVATTAFTVLALQRDEAGSRTHARAIDKGVDFVVKAVETAPSGTRLNTPENTQIQYKLGQLVDTHLAALMLTETLPRLEGSLKTRAEKALKVVIDKVEAAQNADGSFDGNGWAPVLSSSIAARGLNNAVALGYAVDDGVLSKSDDYQKGQVDTTSGSIDASAGAGVQLYAVASSFQGNKQAAKRSGSSAPTASERRELEAAADAAGAAVAQGGAGLISGFGSIGGEEMLSYMMISDSLAEDGGKEWTDWDAKIGGVLVGAQNPDGSWVGHHCITSRAFTTAGGIMTLAAGDAAIQARRG